MYFSFAAYYTRFNQNLETGKYAGVDVTQRARRWIAEAKLNFFVSTILIILSW